MPRFLADENFDNNILRGLATREPTLDVWRVQDAELMHTPDPDILAWAAADGRVVLTHDKNTFPRHAFDRVRDGLPMAGVVVVQSLAPIGQSIEDLLIVAGAGSDDDFVDQVMFLPL